MTNAVKQSLRFEDNIGLVHFQAKRGFRWALSAGVAMNYDDLFQEASVAFLIAARGFKPELGIKFSAYYTQVAFSQFRCSIGLMTGVKNLNGAQREQIAARALDNERRGALAQAPLPNCRFGLDPESLSSKAAEDSTEDLLSCLASPDGTPEQIVEARQMVDNMVRSLSPLARLLVDWLSDPPEPLLQEVACQRAHADYCNEQGRQARGWRDGVTVAVIVKFLCVVGVPKVELKSAEQEVVAALLDMERGNE